MEKKAGALVKGVLTVGTAQLCLLHGIAGREAWQLQK